MSVEKLVSQFEVENQRKDDGGDDESRQAVETAKQRNNETVDDGPQIAGQAIFSPEGSQVEIARFHPDVGQDKKSVDDWPGQPAWRCLGNKPNMAGRNCPAPRFEPGQNQGDDERNGEGKKTPAPQDVVSVLVIHYTTPFYYGTYFF